MRQIVLVLLCLIPSAIWAQDPATSQPYGAPLYLNPAFAGYEGCSRLAMSYRNQWPGLSNNFQTVLASYDQYVHPMRGGIGVNFMFDDAMGLEQSIAASLTYSPVLGLFKRKLLVSPALQLGIGHRKADIYGLYESGFYPRTSVFIEWPDQPSPVISRLFFDAAAGVMLTHHHLTYGFATHHLTEPDAAYGGVSRLPRRFTAHISYRAKFNDKVALTPSFIYMNQADFHTFLSTVAISLWGARIGAGLRTSDQKVQDVIIQAGYSRKWFSVGYSYDITVSSLGNSNTSGSHEVNLQFQFNCKNKEQGRKGDSMWGM